MRVYQVYCGASVVPVRCQCGASAVLAPAAAGCGTPQQLHQRLRRRYEARRLTKPSILGGSRDKRGGNVEQRLAQFHSLSDSLHTYEG